MDQRQTNGQFAAGNPGGPGRPKGSSQEFLTSIRDGVTAEDWAAIVARAVADAKEGNRHARAWLTHYIVGKAPVKLEVSNVGQSASGIDWPAIMANATDEELAAVLTVNAMLATCGLTQSAPRLGVSHVE